MEFRFLKNQCGKDTYLIYKDDEPYYFIKYESTNQKKLLFNLNKELIAEGYYDLERKKMFYFLMPYYVDLQSSDNYLIRIDFKSFPFPVYSFIYKEDSYVAVRHWGYKVSIFKNDYQIGIYLTGKLIKDQLWDMLLIIDDNVDAKLMTLFSIHISSDFTSENNSDGGNANYNVGLQLKRFNKNWRPNMK